MSDILHETNLLLSRIIVDIRQSIGSTESREPILAIIRNGNGSRVSCLTPLGHDHELVLRRSVVDGANRVNTSGTVSSLMTTVGQGGCTVRVSVSHPIGLRQPEAWSESGRRRFRTTSSGEGIEGVGTVELFAERTNFVLECQDDRTVLRVSNGCAVDGFLLSF